MEVTFKGFFSNYLLHPLSKDLTAKQKTVCLCSSIILYIFSLGLIPLGTALYLKSKKIRKVAPSNTPIILATHVQGSSIRKKKEPSVRRRERDESSESSIEKQEEQQRSRRLSEKGEPESTVLSNTTQSTRRDSPNDSSSKLLKKLKSKIKSEEPGIAKEAIEDFLLRVDQNILNSVPQGLEINGGNYVTHIAKSPNFDNNALLKEINIFQKLAKKGAAFNHQDGWGNTPLMWAIANANNNAALSILNLSSEVDIGINAQDKLGHQNTALHLAVGKGYTNLSKGKQRLTVSNLQLVQKLIEQVCNVNIQNSDGNTPLHLACLRRDYNMIKALIDAGAKTDILNNEGLTPQGMLNKPYEEVCVLIKETVSAFLLSESNFTDENTELIHPLFGNMSKGRMQGSDGS